jgi:hypothetical protein
MFEWIFSLMFAYRSNPTFLEFAFGFQPIGYGVAGTPVALAISLKRVHAYLFFGRMMAIRAGGLCRPALSNCFSAIS